MYLKQASPFLAAARGQVAFGSPPSPDNYTTSFDTDQNPLRYSGEWVKPANAWLEVKAASGRALGASLNFTTDLYDDCYVKLSPDVFQVPNDDYEVVVQLDSSEPTQVVEAEILLRVTDSTTTVSCYEILINSGGSIQIVKWYGTMGDYDLISDEGAAGTYTAEDGAMIRARITGTTTPRIQIWSARAATPDTWIEECDWTDDNSTWGASHQTGQPGMGFYVNVDTAPDSLNMFGFASFTVNAPPSSGYALLFPSNVSGSSTSSDYGVIEFANPHSNGLPAAGPSNAGWTVIRRIKCVQQTGYYGQFWWGPGDGHFYADTYFYAGVHPYPTSQTNSGTTHVWEIATEGGDFFDYLGSTTPGDGVTVTKGSWYLQAFRVEYNGGAPLMTLWHSLPSTANADKVVWTPRSGYFADTPPSPKIVIGNSPWMADYQEERASCHLGEIKIIAKALSDADVSSEAADMTQLVTSDAIANIWWGKKGFASVDDLTCDYATGRSFTRNDTNNLITLGDAL